MSEMIDRTSSGVSDLARRGVFVPDGRGNHRRAESERPDTGRASKRVRKNRPEAFAVKVSRKWHNARDRFMQGLRMYTQLDEVELGLVVDYWA